MEAVFDGGGGGRGGGGGGRGGGGGGGGIAFALEWSAGRGHHGDVSRQTVSMEPPPGHTAFSWSGATSVSQTGIKSFVDALASKAPTPGGGAAAAVGAAVGAAAACMAAEYSQRKKDVESGAAAKAVELITKLQTAPCLLGADEDAAAYADLQRSWKDKDMTAAEKSAIEARALAVPVKMVERCHKYVLAVQAFLPHCNPNITSDAKVGIHMLAGAARCAYQTAMVNSPPADVQSKLVGMLKDIRAAEDAILDGSSPAAAGGAAPKAEKAMAGALISTVGQPPRELLTRLNQEHDGLQQSQ